MKATVIPNPAARPGRPSPSAGRCAAQEASKSHESSLEAIFDARRALGLSRYAPPAPQTWESKYAEKAQRKSLEHLCKAMQWEQGPIPWPHKQRRQQLLMREWIARGHDSEAPFLPR